MADSAPNPASPPAPAGAMAWEHFHHVADIGIRGIGPGPERAFEQAALALVAVMADPGDIECTEAVEIRCTAPDLDLLLVDWLNAVVFEIGTRGMLFGAFHVRIDGRELRATAGGERLDPARHRPAAEVKGATLCELEVVQRPDGSWIAQCVVDV